MNKTYRVTIEIDVDADNAFNAARRGWQLLNGPDAILPVCDVKEFKNNRSKTEQVDLAGIGMGDDCVTSCKDALESFIAGYCPANGDDMNLDALNDAYIAGLAALCITHDERMEKEEA